MMVVNFKQMRLFLLLGALLLSLRFPHDGNFILRGGTGRAIPVRTFDASAATRFTRNASPSGG
jgi:hypothetical protein